MIELVYLNLYGTILPENGELILRNGTEYFIDKHKNKKLVISAYAVRDKVELDLKETELINKIDKIFTVEDMKYLPQTKRYNSAPKVWSKMLGIPPRKSVFVSSVFEDFEACLWDGIKLLKVPRFKSKEKDNFSFRKVKLWKAKKFVDTGIL